ncbi:MAG: class I SAM-dependent methyltransferase [Spirochaetales bacterium]|nr:class I SAM-dependent methyltransferase [Spirochaetales bacterium]
MSSFPDIWNGPCPLCREEAEHSHFFTDKFRPYYRCPVCTLIFVPAPWQVTAEQEKARYDQHENDPNDPGYRDFLGRIVPFLEEYLETEGKRGLDFGCGPGPVLGQILEGKGYDMSLYDLYYRDDKSVLEGSSYDFILSTEVFEHLSDPDATATRLFSLLKPGGILALMTRFYEDQVSFKSWFYKDDETHICFYTRQSLSLWAEKKGVKAVFRGKDMVIFKEARSDNGKYEE